MADPSSQDQEKDFLDIDLDAPLDLADETDSEAAPIALPRTPLMPVGEGVLLFDNKKYAVGLTWLIANEEGETELALKRAKDFKADLYTMRQNVVPQQGFGYLKKGDRLNMPALASVAADVLVGEWHGVFTADNGWWYMAVHADNIAPDGDLFFASEEVAYNHFIAQSEAYRWPRTYAPESWNIPEASGEIALAKMLHDTQPPPTLKPVTLDAIFSGKRNKNLAFGAGAIIAGVALVSLLGQQIVPSLIPQQARLPAPNLEISEDIQTPPQQPNASEADESLSYIEIIPPSSMIDDCIAGLSGVSMALPGWAQTTLRCKESFVEASWTRVLGGYETIAPYLSRFPDGVTKAFPDSSNLVISRRIQPRKDLAVARPLFDRNRAIITLKKRLSGIGQLEVREVTPPAGQQLMQAIDLMQQQSGFGSSIVQETPEGIRPLTTDDLPYLGVTLMSRTPPNLIRDYFDLPGMILTTIQQDATAGGWTYEAKLIPQPEQRLLEANAKAKALQVTQ